MITICAGSTIFVVIGKDIERDKISDLFHPYKYMNRLRRGIICALFAASIGICATLVLAHAIFHVAVSEEELNEDAFEKDKTTDAV